MESEARYLALQRQLKELEELLSNLQPSHTHTEFVTITGDTAWMFFACVVVFFMTLPGIMLFYSGMVRVNNVLATAMQGFSVCFLMCFLWMCFGYSLAFAPINSSGDSRFSVYGDASRFWLMGMELTSTHQLAPTIPESLFCMYELSFAVITPALICGAFADRMKFASMLLFFALWHLLVYCPVAHMHWHPDGFLQRLGVLDFAGGDVVHVNAGFAAMVSAIVIGKRQNRKFHPHNMLYSITGATFLWIGWYGFNVGSTFAANDLAGMVMLNTIVAAALSCLTWVLLDFVTLRHATIVGLINASLAGLVGITPACAHVDTSGALIIGIASGLAGYFGVKIKKLLGFDDALDAFGVHGVCGAVGMISVGFLATDRNRPDTENGLLNGGSRQLWVQLVAVLVTVGWSTLGSYVLLKSIDATLGLRVSAICETEGLDVTQHASSMYGKLNAGRVLRGGAPLPKTANEAHEAGKRAAQAAESAANATLSSAHPQRTLGGLTMDYIQ